ncbi:MAG: hypothetical protein J7M14_00155 [Planctomycetes bacterium]|nr:hypothetical protein [Planctomycetota bacterium]
MEVLFALALFTAGAATILTGMRASATTVRTLRRQTVATNLAVTLLSEIRMGLVPAEEDGPNEYEEPYEGWTWEIVVDESLDVVEEPVMKHVEIVIAAPDESYTSRLVFLMPDTDSLGAGGGGRGGRP